MQAPLRFSATSAPSLPICGSARASAAVQGEHWAGGGGWGWGLFCSVVGGMQGQTAALPTRSRPALPPTLRPPAAVPLLSAAMSRRMWGWSMRLMTGCVPRWAGLGGQRRVGAAWAVGKAAWAELAPQAFILREGAPCCPVLLIACAALRACRPAASRSLCWPTCATRCLSTRTGWSSGPSAGGRAAHAS